MAHRLDDGADLLRGHAVRGFLVDPGRHRALVGVDPPVGQQVQLRVEQLPVQFLARQALPAAFTEDTQHRFGILHFANLPVMCIRSPVRLRPADGLPVLPGRP